MKKMLFVAVISFISSYSIAQLTATLALSPTPPGTLMDWADKKETLSLIVINQSGAGGRFIIKAEFKLTDGTVIGNVNLAKARIFNLQAASLVLNAADVIPLELITFTGKYKTALDKSGKLPAGTYMLCIRLLEPGSFRPISEERCRTFTIASIQFALPIMPYNEQVLKAEAAQTAITFRWAPVSPSQSFPVTYRILVFEVLSNQTPMQALRSNIPLLNKDVTGTTQYIWQPQLGMIGCCPMDASADSIAVGNARTITGEVAGKNKKAFIWTLQCLDNLGRPLSDGNINSDGISEPVIFYVGNEADKPKRDMKNSN
jgi:hypothetical protein